MTEGESLIIHREVYWDTWKDQGTKPFEKPIEHKLKHKRRDLKLQSKVTSSATFMKQKPVNN